MSHLTQGQVQYLGCYFTSEKIALIGDRRSRKKAQPNFRIYNDADEEKIMIKIFDILSEPMYATPKERSDIYILKPAALLLQESFQTIVDGLPEETMLDRGDRSPRNPTSLYEGGGKPLRIDKRESWVKSSKVSVYFIKEGFRLECVRRDESAESLPRLNIDVEHDQSRLHIGIAANWAKIESVNSRPSNALILEISYSECGHLLNAINAAITKLND